LDTGGLTRTVIGLGTENGLQYMDVRFNGTANAPFVRYGFDSSTQINASVGQTWTGYTFVKVLSAIPGPTAYVLRHREALAGGTLTADGETSFSPDGNLKRYTFTRTTTGTTTERISFQIQFSVTIGNTYDFTIRIAAPQMELGAFATTFIPTTTAAVTRLADTCSLTGVADLIGQTEGTLFFDFELPSTNQSSGRIYTINDTTASNVIRTEIFALSSTIFQFRTGITTGGVDQGDFFTTITQLQNKIAVSYALNDVKIYINGALAATDTTVNIPATSAIYLANRSNVGNFAAVSFNQAALYTTRLSNTELQSLTTL
jgi:hypothetical protein